MKRISTATRVVNKFGAGKDGFTNGNAATGVAATDLEADLFDHIQEEICRVIEATGGVVDGSSYVQLLAAITALIQSVGDGRYARGGKLQSINWSRAAGALTLSYAGGTLDFPNATLSNGAPVAGVVVPGLNLTVPAAAVLGTISGQSARLALLVMYNAGAPVLAVANIAGGLQLDESNLLSPTTISAGSSLAGVAYSASAVAASSPYRFLGFIDIPGNNAGWVADPTNAKGAGGQASAAMAANGIGQSWQDVAGQRAIGATYYNTTGKEIKVAYNSSTLSTASFSVVINGTTLIAPNLGGASGLSFIYPLVFTVGPGESYTINQNAGSIGNWKERR